MAITRIGGANAISGSITSSNLPTGSVLQVQSFNYGARTVVTSTVITATPLTVSITPSSTSSKILVMASLLGSSGSGTYSFHWQIRRGSSTVIAPNTSQSLTGYREGFMLYQNNDNNVTRTNSFTVLDEPNTTAATSYTVYVQSQLNSTSAVINGSFSDNANQAYSHRGSSTITAVEIQG